MLRNKKGITLIALIITIIVMLILVGVTVTVALNGGLFTTAKQATSETEIELEKERLLELAIGALDNKGDVDFGKLKTAVDKDGTFEEITSSKTMGVYANKKTGNKYTVKSNGSIIEGETEIPTAKWIQSGYTLTYVDAEGNTTDKTLTIGQSINYDEGTNGSYTTEANRGTYASNTLTKGTYTVDGLAEGTIAAGDLNWIVLGANDKGQVELLSTTPTTAKLTLYGKEGYLNAVTDEEGNLGTLDTFCNNLYGQNKEQAISARSVKLEDIYEAAGEELVITKTEYTYKIYENDLYSIEGDSSSLPADMTEWSNMTLLAGLTSMSGLEWTVSAASPGPRSVTTSYFRPTLSVEPYDDNVIVNSILPNYNTGVGGCLLANTFVSAYDGSGYPIISYGVCDGWSVWDLKSSLYDGRDLSYQNSNAVHPVVILKPDASILFN